MAWPSTRQSRQRASDAAASALSVTQTNCQCGQTAKVSGPGSEACSTCQTSGGSVRAHHGSTQATTSHWVAVACHQARRPLACAARSRSPSHRPATDNSSGIHSVGATATPAGT